MESSFRLAVDINQSGENWRVGAPNYAKAVSVILLVGGKLNVSTGHDNHDYSVFFSVESELALLIAILVLVETRLLDTRQWLVADLRMHEVE